MPDPASMMSTESISMDLSIIQTSLTCPSTLLSWLWLPMPVSMLIISNLFHDECWKLYHRSSNILFFHGLANILVIFLQSLVCFTSSKSDCLPVDKVFKNVNSSIVGIVRAITYFIALVISIDAIDFCVTEILVTREIPDPMVCQYVYNLALAYSIILSVVVLLLVLLVIVAFVIGVIWTELLIGTNYIGENSVLNVRWFQRPDQQDEDEEDGGRRVSFVKIESLPMNLPVMSSPEPSTMEL